MSTAPLLDLFFELRRRNLPLGVSEYLAALQALAAGFGGGTRAELCWMCQAIWSKSPEDHEQIAEAFDAVLPRKFTEADLQKLAQQAQRELEQQAAERPSDARAADGQPLVDENVRPEKEEPTPGRMELSPITSASADTPVLARAAEEVRGRYGAGFTLVGELPVPKRYIKRAWRYVRRMQRVGPATELDVEATANRRYREGVLVAPVLVPRRRNLASVLLLVDEGGSMIPFRQATAALVEAAQHSGFARTDVCYFHDMIGDPVYRSPGLRSPIALADVLRSFASGGVLILSDAGAARRRLDQERAEMTRQSLELMRRRTPRIVWLNPVPQSRWRATTAEAIDVARLVPMFPFDRGGLNAAMDILRGRSR